MEDDTFLEENHPFEALKDDPEFDTVHQPYSAYLQGHAAGDRAMPIEMNPYEVDSAEYVFWNEGHTNGSEDGD